MKKILSLGTALFITIAGFAQSAKDDFAGKWKTNEGVVITIKNNNGKFTGTDPKGRLTLYNVRFEKNEWKGNVENHETAQKGNCEIYLQGNKIKIVAHKGVLPKTFYWVKQ